MSDTLVLYKTVDFSACAPQNMEQRNAIWCKLYEEGKSSQEIADMYSVTRERVYQILRKGNLIEHRMQRRRFAAELFEQDKEQVRAKRTADEERLLALVRAGDSLATAASKVGFTTPVATWICKKHGVKSNWGRWRDPSQRVSRLTELVESGLSLNAAMRLAGEEEGKTIAYLWVQHNCPQLLKKNRPRSAPLVAPTPKPPKIKPQPSGPFPQLEWSEDRISRLIALWFNGSSAQQIADIFGDCTKNAIIGQIYRLRIAGKLRVSA